MIDVLVTCRPHGEELLLYPQIRGYYLARHLSQIGLRAEFRQLPLPGYRCEVLISSEYQSDMAWFAKEMIGLLTEVDADRLYCMTDNTIGTRDHFSRAVLEWFAARGGVLCMGSEEPPAPFEHWIGVGVDIDVIPTAQGPRTNVLFDFASDSADQFDTRQLDRIRRRLPDVRLVATGPAGTRIEPAFDEWVPYGQPHPTYLAAALDSVFALVLGSGEALGLLLAEAQVSGASVVVGPYQAKDWMLCAAAQVPYRRGDADSLVAAIEESRKRSPELIQRQARARFDFTAVAERTRLAIGLGARPPTSRAHR